MKRTTLATVCIAMALPLGGAAVAQQHQHNKDMSSQTTERAEGQADGGSMMSMGADGPGRHGMMQKMMKMHEQMHGRSGMSRHGMMDDDMMGMMGMMRGHMQGQKMGAEDRTEALLSRHSEFDADGNGTLSIDEFEALHSAMIRETMVDRFQHLDADGNGEVTPEEMTAPAERMMQRKMMSGDAPMGGMKNGHDHRN